MSIVPIETNQTKVYILSLRAHTVDSRFTEWKEQSSGGAVFISREKFPKRESKTRERIVSQLVMLGYAIDRPRCCRKVDRRFDLV